MASRSFQTVATLTCLKTLVVLFNIVFLLSGLLLIALGVWLRIELHKYMDVNPESNDLVPYILIATGVMILSLAILACCCAYREQSILLYAYAAFLAIIFVIEVGACISGYHYRERLNDSFKAGLQTSINAYGQDYARTTAINAMQTHLHCCGVESYKDWQNTTENKVPGSCCISGLGSGMSCDTTNSENIYIVGCYQLISDFLASKLSLMAGIALALACFQVVGIFLIISLANSLHETKYEKIKE